MSFQTPITIADAVRRIQAQELVLPAIKREFVWEEGQITRLFDSKTPPEKGMPIDDPGHIPAIYKGADPRVSEFEQQLWRDFWKLANDPQYREQMGVDVLQGKSIWWRFEPGILYTISLQADADLTLRYQPLKGIYKEMLKGAQSRPATGPA